MNSVDPSKAVDRVLTNKENAARAMKFKSFSFKFNNFFNTQVKHNFVLPPSDPYFQVPRIASSNISTKDPSCPDDQN